MHVKILGLTLLAGALAGTAAAQVVKTSALPARTGQGYSVALIFAAERAKLTGSGDNYLWLDGGSVQLERNFSRSLSGVVEVSGTHATDVPSGYTGFDLITATAGPRYSLKPVRGRAVFFGQGLVGGAFGFNGIFPNSSGATHMSANGFALKLGGGLNVALRGHFTLRAVEANWLYTRLTNAGNNQQNTLQLGSGLVYRF